MESFSWTFRAGFRVTQQGALEPYGHVLLPTEGPRSYSSRRLANQGHAGGAGGTPCRREPFCKLSAERNGADRPLSFSARGNRPTFRRSLSR